MRWERVEQGGPGKRWGHTCNAIKGGRFFYVFGGYGQDNCRTNLVHVFDSVKQTWSQAIVKGNAPAPRDSHSCTIIRDNLVVFGGTDGTKPLKDLHILDTSSNTWICPTIRGEGPEAREGHSSTLVGKRLFIFGGCGKSPYNNDVYYNDVYILNTETFVWKKPVTTGSPPSARDSHTCSSWKNKMIVIGGEDGHDYYLSDVHILDADTLMWKEVKASGQMLPPRAGHSTVAFGKMLFVFGGFTEGQNLYDDLYMLDIDAGIWSRVTTSGEGPSARFSMAGDSLDPVKSGLLFFIGGCNKTLEALDDMYYLHTGLVTETERKSGKLSLKQSLKLKCQGQSSTLVPRPIPERFGLGTNYFLPKPKPKPNEPIQQQQGKVEFQARVTESLPCGGYIIDTVIDGKPLRGVVLSNNPTNVQVPPPTIHNTRKRGASGKMKAVVTPKERRRRGQQDSVDCKQGEQDPTQTPLEASSALDKVPASQQLSVNPADMNIVELGSEDDQKKDPTDDAPPMRDDQKTVADDDDAPPQAAMRDDQKTVDDDDTLIEDHQQVPQSVPSSTRQDDSLRIEDNAPGNDPTA